MSLGSSKSYKDILQIMTKESSINMDGLLAYFQPLYDWLVEKNRLDNVEIGWESSTSELFNRKKQFYMAIKFFIIFRVFLRKWCSKIYLKIKELFLWYGIKKYIISSVYYLLLEKGQTVFCYNSILQVHNIIHNAFDGLWKKFSSCFHSLKRGWAEL